MFNLASYLDNEKHLVHYAWPGGYPMFYLTKEDEVLCPSCADAEKQTISAADANWEDPDLYCEQCSKRIESAYVD